jgi:FAD/FMN-containing dehydrogenase
VTADGRVVRASTEENPELLWGLRGGGGNFGVVTEFEFQLYPVGPIVFGGQILHPRSAARELLRFYREFMAQAPDEVAGGFTLMTAPPVEFVPPEVRGRSACGMFIVYAGDPARGAEAFRPLLEWGDPLVSRVGPIPYTAVQSMLDPLQPWGIHHYAKVGYVPEFADEAVYILLDQADRMSSPSSSLLLGPLGGEVARMDRSQMALEMPEASWVYFVASSWWDPRGREEHIAWARGVMDAMRPWTADAAPPNFIGADEGTERLRRSYGEEKFRRLVALKDAYDPGNVFALNQNIPPSGSAGGRNRR